MKAKRRGGFRGSWAGGEIYWKDLGEAEVPADAAEPGAGSGASGTKVPQCWAEVRQLRAECGAPDGLKGAIASGLVSGDGGVAQRH